MVSLARKIWQRGSEMLPVAGFRFDRPLVLLQSDDWGRVGLRDQEGLQQLQAAGIALGDKPYDFYTLETAEDLAAVSTLLKGHRDSAGGTPCLEMNFMVANLDFARINHSAAAGLPLMPLAEGLPGNWKRPKLADAYRRGVADGVFGAALHGSTHFCQAAVERNAVQDGERARLLRTLWTAGTPYIHWRMPWIGYEYWDPERPEDQRFLPAKVQMDLIGQSVGLFAKMFTSLPRSACAPGYRANDDTHRAWARQGVRVAQNGPGLLLPPFLGGHELLHLTRNVEFEPATDPEFSLEKSLRQAERCFELGIPAIVSVHSINFHSSVKNFRDATLRLLDEFLTALESKHADLLYLHDENLFDVVSKGSYTVEKGDLRVNVKRENFLRSKAERFEA
jgi:hypothetical protein